MKAEMAIVPPGGVWKFVQKLPNGNVQMFVSWDETDLAKQVTKFRMNNNLEIGDVKAEIERSMRPRTANLKDERSLRERVTGWKSNRAYQKLEFVSPEEAERRAQICVDCPFNQAKYADDCIECHAHVEQDLYAMRQGRTTSQDQWLGACQITGQENKTAAQLAEHNLLHRNNFTAELREKKPDCWLLSLDSHEPTEGV